MVNKFLDAITIALHKKFGDSYHYYVENVQQDLKTPCFTVDMLNALERSTNSTTYHRTMPVVIHYFSSANTTTPKHESYAAGEDILEALEYIVIDDRIIRGEDMELTMVDDVLQVFVTYKFWTENKTEPAYMEDLEELHSTTP